MNSVEAELPGLETQGIAAMDIQETRDQLTVKNAVVPNSEFDDVNMSNTTFNNINLSVARITRANLTNARIDDANMANITINDVKLSNGRITNSNLSNLAIQDCLRRSTPQRTSACGRDRASPPSRGADVSTKYARHAASSVSRVMTGSCPR